MKVRLGIIGTGIAARDLHLPALERLRKKFEIMGVCNHTGKKARDFSRLVGGVPYFLDYRDLLRQNDVDAVDIILPIELNLRVTRDSLEAGKHVIVEKPIASNLSDAEAMAALQDKFEKVMMVAENYRYNPVFARVKELMTRGSIGSPFSVFWDHFTLMDEKNKYAKTKWRINHKYPGGFVMDAGIHNIAVLRDLFGEIESGVAFTRSVNPAIGRMDSMSFQFVFASGVNGVFNMYFSSKLFERNQLTVLGSRGSIIVEGNSVTVRRERAREIKETIKTDRGYTGQFEDFYESIVNDRRPVSTFEEAYKDFRTMIAALESGDRWSRLPMEAKGNH